MGTLYTVLSRVKALLGLVVAAGGADITGNSTVTGNLGVTGNATVSGTLGVTGILTASHEGSQKGAVLGSIALSKSADYALAAGEKANVAFLLTATASSKTYTLGLTAGQVALVYNASTETFTLKNVAGDSGTAIATGKIVLLVASATGNASTVIALN